MHILLLLCELETSQRRCKQKTILGSLVGFHSYHRSCFYNQIDTPSPASLLQINKTPVIPQRATVQIGCSSGFRQRHSRQNNLACLTCHFVISFLLYFIALQYCFIFFWTINSHVECTTSTTWFLTFFLPVLRTANCTLTSKHLCSYNFTFFCVQYFTILKTSDKDGNIHLLWCINWYKYDPQLFTD